MVISNKVKSGLYIAGGVLFVGGVISFILVQYNKGKEETRIASSTTSDKDKNTFKSKNNPTSLSAVSVGGIKPALSLLPILSGGKKTTALSEEILATQGRGFNGKFA